MQEIAKQEKANIHESFFKYIKNIKRRGVRIASLIILLMFIVLGTIYAPVWLVDPNRNIELLARQVSKPGKYSAHGGFLYVYDSRDYIVTLYSGEDEVYHLSH